MTEAQRKEMKELQSNLGCYFCDFSDRKAIETGYPCCCKAGRPVIEGEPPICKSKRDIK